MMLTLFASVLFIKGVFSLAVIPPPAEINVTINSNSSIALNCTYRLDTNEYIDIVHIKKKTSSGEYKDLVRSTERGTHYTPSGEYLRYRSNIYGINTESSSAALIINDVRCEDDGQYQCELKYVSNDKPLNSMQNTTVYIHANAEQPTFSFPWNNVTAEHDIVILQCSANVGSPQGLLEIWREDNSSRTRELMGNTSAVSRDIENCTSIANLTVTYNLTRQDNGAMFKCSSWNKYANNPILAADIGQFNVFYATSNTTISASSTNLFAGDIAELNCVSDGNPSPNYTWIFNFTEVLTGSKYSLTGNNSKLSFTTNLTDNGYYQCVSSNFIKGQMFNSSSYVVLTIQENSEEKNTLNMELTCSKKSCSLIQSCVSRNGRAHCSLNIWSIIAFVFIALTVISGAACVSLILSRKPRRKNDQTNGIGDVHISYTREKFEDFGGYADPKDVKRPEK